MAFPNISRPLLSSETYLTASIVGIGLAILGLYAFLSFSNYQSIVAKELEGHTAALERAAVEIESFIDTRFLLLQELAGEVGVNLPNASGREEKVSLFLHRYPEFQKIKVTDARGEDLTAVSRLLTLGRGDLKNSSEDPAFQKAKDGNLYIGKTHIGFGAIPATELAAPISDEMGRVQGVIIADLDLRKIWDTVSQIKVGERGAVYVVDGSGNLVAHPDRQFALTVANLQERGLIGEVIKNNNTGSATLAYGQYINERNEDVFSAARSLPFGWAVVVEEPRQEFFRASASVLYLNLVVAGVTALLIIILIFIARSLLVLFRELKKERTEKAEIIANLSDGLLVTDKKGKVALINARARDFLGITGDITGLVIRPPEKGYAAGETWPKIFFPSDAPRGIFRDIMPRREIELSSPLELHLTLDTIIISEEKDNAPAQILFVLRDVTRERVLSRLKSEFISIAAHQLRTPLSAIKWALRLLLDGDFGPMNPKQQEYLQSGYETNERMIRLVNDLLDVSRIEEGRFEFLPQEEDLVSLTGKVVESFKNIAIEKSIELSFHKPAPSPSAIPIDRQKIEMVLQNLIENALAYTPAGGSVVVSIGEETDMLTVTVSDSGIGIPPEERERLFGKFYRSARAVKMQPGGSGLGLFISHNIIVGHRGSIEVKSEVNRGATFIIKLPKKLPPAS